MRTKVHFRSSSSRTEQRVCYELRFCSELGNQDAFSPGELELLTRHFDNILYWKGLLV